MIVVLADDFTGAAELAGIGAAHGLKAEVWIGCDDESDAQPDLIAIDCGTRSLTEAAAENRVIEIAHRIEERQPSWIFKKTDSVLRGHVAIECAAIAHASGYQRVILIPANPSRQRCIVKSLYLINGTLLSQTVFANDPEFPVRSSDVHGLLRNRSGIEIEIPDVATEVEVNKIASGLHDIVLPAGAADFFAAILRQQHLSIARQPEPLPDDHSASLWICGSRAAWLGGLPEYCQAHGITVATLPSLPPSLPACLAIGDGGGSQSDKLLEHLITAAIKSIERLNPAQLFVEGGATASALCQALDWRRFAVCCPNSDGIGILAPFAARAPTLFVKPGSYPWSPSSPSS